MSSLIRRIQRKRARLNGTYVPKDTPTKLVRNGYYTLHYTKGWRWISKSRLRAQEKMEALYRKIR